MAALQKGHCLCLSLTLPSQPWHRRLLQQGKPSSCTMSAIKITGGVRYKEVQEVTSGNTVSEAKQ